MSLRSRHLVAYASAMLALMILQLIFGIGVFATASDFDYDIIYTLLSQVLCMGVIPFVVLSVLSKGRFADNFRIMRYKAPRDKRSCLLICLALMILITPFTMVFNALTNLFFNIIGYKRIHPVGTVYLGIGDLFLMIFFTAVLPAIFEEFCHRGILMSGLENRGSELSAVLLSALLFSLMHENPPQLLYAFFGGLVFGVVVIKTDSIIPAMCAHFANNAVAVLLEYSEQRETWFGRLYDKLLSTDSILSFGVLLLLLSLSLFAIIRLLQYAARKAPKPISERKLLGVVTLDGYRPDGKATLKDNAFLIAVIVSESLLAFSLLVWGVVR